VGQFAPKYHGQFAPKQWVSLRRNGVVSFIIISTDTIVVLDNKKSRHDIDLATYNSLVSNPCSQLDTNYDDFSREKKFSTGYVKPTGPDDDPAAPISTKFYNVIFYKYICKTGVSYYINLNSNSITPLATERGVIIILKNKTRINKPNALVETKVNENGDEFDRYTRSSFIRLTANDLLLLKASPIDEYELYDSQESETDFAVLHQMFMCLLKAK
jgi:hypothetical protein